MNRKLRIGIFAALLAIGIGSFLLLRNSQNPVSPEGISGPSFPKEGYFSLGSKDENKVIYQKIKTALRNAPSAGSPGVFAVDQFPASTDIPVSVAPEYSIVFFEDKTTFTIIVNARPLTETRKKAEQALLRKLGISEVEACHLNVDLGVISSVDIDMSGKNFGLSFCPNGTSFPLE